MAQRFGGQFSPTGQEDTKASASRTFQGARRSRVGGRVNLLFAAPLPLVFSAFGNGPVALALNLSALGLLLLAAWLTREGLRAEEAYEARKVARAPGVPRKLFGGLAIGAGLAVAGFASSGGVLEPAIYAVVGLILHVLAFGLDPMKAKGVDGVDLHQTARVARAIDTAEEHLRAMADAISRAGDRRLEARVGQFQVTARDLFRTVEEDPRDLTAARKYLGVYLKAARDATVKFSDFYARSQSQKARQDYEALLDDLERNFAARTTKLLNDDRSDLTVEIEVLRERMQREGIRVTDKE